MEQVCFCFVLFVFALEVSLLFFTLSKINKNVSLLADKNYDNLFWKPAFLMGLIAQVNLVSFRLPPLHFSSRRHEQKWKGNLAKSSLHQDRRHWVSSWMYVCFVLCLHLTQYALIFPFGNAKKKKIILFITFAVDVESWILTQNVNQSEHWY